MVRTQVQFEEKQYETIRRLAHRHRISVAAAIRNLVDRGLKLGLDFAPRKDRSPLLKLAGAGASGVSDLGRRHDDYLAGALEEPGSRTGRGRRPRSATSGERRTARGTAKAGRPSAEGRR